MCFIADLHIHSKYSIATAKNLDPENLYIWAQKKGITVLATGDITHPQWFKEISSKLEPAEEGLYRLKREIAAACDPFVPLSCRGAVRFMLVSEISNIYKKNGKTRKNHNLVYLPDLNAAATFNRRLDKIGNIRSDGRPILGMDARDLLEELLSVSDDAFLIPAHIWTPWFSLLGSKSGFDSLEECFEDLSDHIFAAETGLSSDPPMNWRVSGLDRLTLVSSSDAHSPRNLGREATIFNCERSFPAIREAIRSADPAAFLGTIEFFPQEGKYHADGHRSCNVCLQPKETIELEGICPVCGKPLTCGVCHRVEALADRPGEYRPDNRPPFTSLVPLVPVLSHLLDVGPSTKKVSGAYDAIIDTLGPELDILMNCDEERLASAGVRLLPEAIRRIRSGRITMQPGYDGAYGVLKIFSHTEKEYLLGQQMLFDPPVQKKKEEERCRRPAGTAAVAAAPLPMKKERKETDTDVPAEGNGFSSGDVLIRGLNRRQQEAVTSGPGEVLIVAGPGTGKTHTLTRKIARLLESENVNPQTVVALTFTNRAADEMKNRLLSLLPSMKALPFIGTFHGWCLELLKELVPERKWYIADEREQLQLVHDAVVLSKDHGIIIDLPERELLRFISMAKQKLKGPGEMEDVVPSTCVRPVAAIYRFYQELLQLQGRIDFEDLLARVVHTLERDEDAGNRIRTAVHHLFVDEYQDLNTAQYRLILDLSRKRSTPLNLCAIGDPDQAIYAFRGSDAACFHRFTDDFHTPRVYHLNRNYRSTDTILTVSRQVLHPMVHKGVSTDRELYSGIEGIEKITLFETPTQKAEAVAIGKQIEAMVEGTGFNYSDFSLDKKNFVSGGEPRSFADFAVLFRTRNQGKILRELLEKGGIPCDFASRDRFVELPGVKELLAFLRIACRSGSYGDLEAIRSLLSPSLSRAIVTDLKVWGYVHRKPLAEALEAAPVYPLDGFDNARQLKLVSFIEQLDRLVKAAAPLSSPQLLEHLLTATRVGALLSEQDGEVLFRLRERFRSDRAVPELLASFALETDADMIRTEAEKVKLMTIHASKGLEFPVVFISGCEDGLLPYRHSDTETRMDHRKVDVEEERRLLYVAMTRAREQLFLSCAARRTLHGVTEQRKPSPFLDPIAAELIELRRDESFQRKKHQIQLELF
jgi:DNA helicase-2/ATP-dependent DNA helicase PcrA